MGESIIDGRGNFTGGSKYIAWVTEDGKLQVDASVSIGSVSVDAGSQSYLFGKSGTDYYPLLVTSGADGGLLRIAGTFSADTGSVVYQGTSPWITLGSTNIDNAAAVGSLALQSVSGNVLVSGTVITTQGTSPWAISGTVSIPDNVSTEVTNTVDVNITDSIALPITTAYQDDAAVSLGEISGLAIGGLATTDAVDSGDFGIFKINTNRELIIAGSVAVTSTLAVSGNTLVSGTVAVTQSTSPWIVLGSVNMDNAAGVGSLSLQNVSLYGSSGTDIGIYPIRVQSGTTAAMFVAQTSSTRTISAGSVIVTNTASVSGNVLVSGTVATTQSTSPWITLGSVNVNNAASVGSLALQSISGNVLVSGTVAVTQSTSPWVVLGSTNINNAAAVGSLSLYKSSLYGSSGTDLGLYPIAVTSGTVGTLIVNQGTSPWTILGSVNIDNAVSVGSISTQNISGNVLVSGTVAFRGVGSIYGIGVGSVAVAVISPATIGSLATQNMIGSVHVTQSTNPWITLGSTQITNPTSVGSYTLQNVSLYGTSGTGIGTYPLAVTSGTVGTLIVNQGTSPWAVSGNVLVSGTVINTPIGVGSIYGIGVGSMAVAVINPAAVGSYSVQSISGNVLISGAVNQGTSPWIVNGSINVNNATAVGSLATQTIVGSAAVTNIVSVQGLQAEGAAFTGSPIPIAFKDIFGNAIVPTGVTTGGGITVMGVLGIDLNGNLWAFSGGCIGIFGDAAHDAVDAGQPIKIGGKATDYEPDQAGVPNGSLAEVADADRANLTMNRWGQIIEGVNSFYYTPGSVNSLYQTGLTIISDSAECWNYRQASFSYEMYKSGTVTDFLWEVEASLDGTNFAIMQNDFLGDLRESNSSIGSGIKKTVTFPIACQKIRVKGTPTGVSGTNHIIVSGARIYLRN